MAVQWFPLAMLSERVPDVPPSSETNVPPVYDSDEPAVMVEVETVFRRPPEPM